MTVEAILQVLCDEIINRDESVARLAVEANVARTTLYYVLNPKTYGTGGINLGTACRIAEALGLEIVIRKAE